MRCLIFRSLFLLPLLFINLPDTVQAQSQSAITQIMNDMAADGWDVGNEYEASIQQDDYWYEYRTCYEDYDYVVYAIPQETGVLDLDIYVYDQDGYELVKDTQSDQVSRITFTPSSTQEFKLKVVNYSSDSRRAYKVKVIAFYRDKSSTSTYSSTGSGAGFPPAMDSYGSSEVQRIKDGMDAMGFTLGDEYTSKIAEGEYWYKYRTCYTGNYYVAYAIPNESGVNDLDIVIADQDGYDVTSESSTTAQSMVEWDPSEDQEFKIKVLNYDSYSSTKPYDVTILVFYGTRPANSGNSTIASGGSGQAAVDNLKSAMELLGYDVGSEYDCRVAQGDYWVQYRDFYSGNDYAVYAIPMTTGVTDLDITLADQDGYELVTDGSSSSTASVEHSFNEDQECRIKETNYSSSTTSAYDVKVLVFYQTSGTSNASTTNTTVSNPIVAQMESEGYSVGSEYEAVIREGDSWYEYREFYDGNDYVIMAIPRGSGVSDLSIEMIDDDGTRMIKDSQRDPTARIEYSFHSTRECKIIVRNEDSAQANTNYTIDIIVFYK